MAKINIDKLMDDCVSIQNQLNGLELLLTEKKQTLARYFEMSGKKQLSNDDCVISVAERANIEYDIEKLEQKLDPSITAKFISKEYKILHWKDFVDFMKYKGISGKELRKYFLVDKKIDSKKLTELYEKKVITINDISDCYTAKVSKSIVLRLKNAKREISIT